MEAVAITLPHLPSTLKMFEWPEAADDWFLVYCFYFSFHPEWNHCPARLRDWKTLVPCRLWLIPKEPWGWGSDNRQIQHTTSHTKGRALLAVGRSHHSLLTRPLWCPLDGMSVAHGGKSISHVQREWRCGGTLLSACGDTLEADYNV